MREVQFLFLCLFVVGFTKVYAQQHTYSIRAAGKEIGEITTSLTKSGDIDTYEVVSEVNFQILWKNYHRKTTNSATYRLQGLQESLSEVYMNNDLEDSSTMIFVKDQYDCYRHPNETFAFSHNGLQFTTVKLYFQEPVGINQVYSERFLEYCPLEFTGDHKYKLYLPNGKINYYTYANNSLVEVFVDRTWFNLKFARK